MSHRSTVPETKQKTEQAPSQSYGQDGNDLTSGQDSRIRQYGEMNDVDVGDFATNSIAEAEGPTTHATNDPTNTNMRNPRSIPYDRQGKSSPRIDHVMKGLRRADKEVKDSNDNVEVQGVRSDLKDHCRRTDMNDLRKATIPVEDNRNINDGSDGQYRSKG